jgi:hypothetical protein
MQRFGAIVAAAAVALAVCAGAGAARPPQVIASSRASGQHVATTVQARKQRAGALYLRAYGEKLSGSAAVTCLRGTSAATKVWPFRMLVAGRLYRLPTPLRGGDCSIAATVAGAGRIRAQVLA